MVVLCLLGASVLFANSDGTAAVADDAAVQVRAQGMIGAVAVSRAVFSEALVIGLARETEQISSASFEAILADADAVIADLRFRAPILTSVLSDRKIEEALDDYLATATTLVANLAAGNTEAAQGVDAVRLRAAFDRATELLVAERDARERHIAAIRGGVADVATAARFLVAFLIPVATIVSSLMLIRRRQRRLQAEADIAQEEAMRSAKDEFLAAVAHELRTPLTAVVGFAETLRDPTRDLSATDRQELVEILADQATETASIVDDLLVFARANSGELKIRIEAVDARDLVEKATSVWASSTPDRLKIIGEAVVQADPLRLRQVLRNLVSNALEFGGPNIEIRLRQTGPRAIIEVADDGIGIPEEARSEIFKPFRLGVSRQGQPAKIGLGLTVARTLVRIMDGELDYRYQAGASTFQVTLPAVRRDSNKDRELVRRGGSNHLPTASEVVELLTNEQFRIVYQPIIDLHHPDQPVIGYEALTRFPSGSAYDWFGTAAASGVGLELQLATIKAAVSGFERMPSKVFLSVNASMDTLMSPKLKEALAGIAAQQVVLELSEETVIDNYTRAKVYLDRLVKMGYRIAFDDLARGRIDPWYLVRLRPAIVKIDISMISNIDQDPNKRTLLSNIKWLSDVLKSRIVAEGIERIEEKETVAELGIHYGQGFLLGYPGPLPTESNQSIAMPVLVQAGAPASSASDYLRDF